MFVDTVEALVGLECDCDDMSLVPCGVSLALVCDDIHLHCHLLHSLSKCAGSCHYYALILRSLERSALVGAVYF
jgi:hypothetical protein